MGIDFECNGTDRSGRRDSDFDLSEAARMIRYREYLGLSVLPFWSERQAVRFNVLRRLRVRDNRTAFETSAWAA